MDLIQIAITVSALLCSWVAGFLLAFAVVVMPGIKSLKDREFLQAFKKIDGVIQNNQPIFILVWLGSLIALLASAGIGFFHLDGAERTLLLLAAVVYVIGVQLPTITINVPLNNQLQQQDLDTLTQTELEQARTNFEPRWIRWNTIRTILALLTSMVLILLVFMMGID